MDLGNPLWISEQLFYPSDRLSKSMPPSKAPKVIANVLKAKDGASSARASGLWIIYSWYPEPSPCWLYTFRPWIDYNSSGYFSVSQKHANGLRNALV